MINFLIFIISLILCVYLLTQIFGQDALSTPIRLLLERFSKCRNIEPAYGFYNIPEADDFGRTISPFFAAVTCINIYYDADGWQFVEYEIVQTASENVPGLRQAIAIAARNYIKTNHGINNADIFVPVLCNTLLTVQLACSPKAHALSQALNFSPLPKSKGAIEEEIK